MSENAEQSVAPDRETQARTGEAELRLALVCYGGVYLAVYMHGVTKELHKLVVAARRLEDVADVDANTAFPDGEPGSTPSASTSRSSASWRRTVADCR